VDGGEGCRAGRDGCRAWAWIRGRFGPDLGREGRRFPSRRGWRLWQRAGALWAVCHAARGLGRRRWPVRPAMEEGKEVRAVPWSPWQWPAKVAGVAGAAPAGSSASGRGGMFSDSLLRRVAGRGGGRRERNAFPVPVTLVGLSLVVFRPWVPVGLLVDSGVEVGARRNPGFCRRRRRLWAS
jgi:hypothetical protein